MRLKHYDYKSNGYYFVTICCSRIVAAERSSALWGKASFAATSHSRFFGGIIAHNTYTSGNVGIGTTSPAATLHVNGNLKAQMKTDLGGNAAVWAGTTDDAIYELGYDVAELFEASEEVAVGDLLVADKEGPKLRKSRTPYEPGAIGVVSGAPAILFEGSSLEIAPQPFQFSQGTKPPVALAGRIKVKVCMENGAIKAGDYLTSSSQPGYAMKATQTGRVIGIALESAQEEGMIICFVNPHYYVNPKEFEDLRRRLERIESAQLQTRSDRARLKEKL